MLVLGVESSCDETAVAVLRDGEILANLVASQIEVHEPFGGVVPELAARKHLEALGPLFHEAVAQAGVELEQLDLICATRGPGLIGALLVGLSAAKAIAWSRGIPFVGVNHVVAHVYANYLLLPEPKTPFVCLTVSGGHTDLFYLPSGEHLRHVGRTRDDAAGECLDKSARLLGLGYPGGPALEKLARGGRPCFEFPSPAMAGGFDFSFSGLKTAVVNLHHRLVQKGEEIPRADLAASLQEAVVAGLATQLRAAAQAFDVPSIMLAGGVASNGVLRERIMEVARELGAEFRVPPPGLCTDNAAMVACAGLHRFLEQGPDRLDSGADPDLDPDG